MTLPSAPVGLWGALPLELYSAAVEVWDICGLHGFISIPSSSGLCVPCCSCSQVAILTIPQVHLRFEIPQPQFVEMWNGWIIPLLRKPCSQKFHISSEKYHGVACTAQRPLSTHLLLFFNNKIFPLPLLGSSYFNSYHSHKVQSYANIIFVFEKCHSHMVSFWEDWTYQCYNLLF